MPRYLSFTDSITVGSEERIHLYQILIIFYHFYHKWIKIFFYQMDLLLAVYSYSRDYKLDAAFWGSH